MGNFIEREEDGYKIKIHENAAGKRTIIKILNSSDVDDLIENQPQPTPEQITEENLLETKYQTLLLEMML